MEKKKEALRSTWTDPIIAKEREGQFHGHKRDIRIYPEVFERLVKLFSYPEMAPSGVTYSSFINRACELAETEIAVRRRFERQRTLREGSGRTTESEHSGGESARAHRLRLD